MEEKKNGKVEFTEEQANAAARGSAILSSGELTEEKIDACWRFYRGETTPEEEDLAALRKEGFIHTEAVRVLLERVEGT